MLDVSTVLLFLSAAFLLASVVRGPEIQHRIIAADAMAVIISMIIVLLAVKFSEVSLLDVCLVFALLSFADVLILAKYFEKGELQK